MSARSRQARRTNEYFIPKEGINREVITTDLSRYLGTDAMLRVGVYENPQTRQTQEGYFITAHRPLTTAMVADLKEDSERFENERRSTASAAVRSYSYPNDYHSSITYQSRQYYGPSEVGTYSTESVGAGGGDQWGGGQKYSGGYQTQSSTNQAQTQTPTPGAYAQDGVYQGHTQYSSAAAAQGQPQESFYQGQVQYSTVSPTAQVQTQAAVGE